MIEASAPGRVNLIGEHTDYNGGFALPSVIPLETRVRVEPRSDQRVHVTSDTEAAPAQYSLGDEKPTGTWLDYVAGLTWSLRRNGLRRAHGFDLQITSDVPVGKGLSSSAALEVSVLRGLRALYSLTLSDLEIAMLAHTTETQFVGAPVGVMDQMVCSLGSRGSAFFLDAATRGFHDVRLPPGTSIRIIARAAITGFAAANATKRRGR